MGKAQKAWSLTKKGIRTLRMWSYLVIPGVLGAMGGAEIYHRWTAEEKHFQTTLQHIRVGNFDAAYAHIEEEEGHGKDHLDFLVNALIQNQLTLEEVQNYHRFHDQEARTKNLSFVEMSIPTNSTTSLEKITATDGRDFYAIGDELGNLFFFDTNGWLRTRVSDNLKGKLTPIEREGHHYLLAKTSDGLIYEIGLEKMDANNPQEEGFKKQTNYKPVIRQLFDAGENISDITPYDLTNDGSLEYFVQTKSGLVLGINPEGQVTFRGETPKKQKLDSLFPPTIANIDKDEPVEIISYAEEGKLLLYSSYGGKPYKAIHIGDKKIIQNILVGDVTGDNSPSLFVMTEGGAYRTHLNPFKEENLDLPAKGQPNYTWALTDVNKDGIQDLVATSQEHVQVFFGDKDEPLQKTWTYAHGDDETLGLVSLSTPLFADILRKDGVEMVVGTDEGNVSFLNPETGKLMKKMNIGLKFKGDRIKAGNMNGENYLTFFGGTTGYILGSGWFK